tara:strand:- start:170 stop:793 length:624 start_codon:yes stop_codon:yes gene_type:complete
MDLMYVLISAYLIYISIAIIGISLGYHRYFSHREFKATAWLEIIMLYCGLLCGGRSLLGWAGVHRMHHIYADTENDPHSAKNHPWWKILFSLWKVNTLPRKFIKDLLQNKRVMFFHKYGTYIFIVHQIIFFLLFGVNSLIVHAVVFFLAYLGFGILNLWGHNLDGPINRAWINLIAPLEGNHKTHHANNQRSTLSLINYLLLGLYRS